MVKKPYLAELCRLLTRINPVNLVKNRARDPPLRSNYIGKIPIFFSFGGRKPLPLNGQIWQGGAVPNFTLIGATCVKTIPAELPAADPAGKKWKTSRDFHEILHGDRGGPCHHFRSKTFLGPVHSFAARVRRKFGWKRPHRSKLLTILSFIEIKQPYLAKLCRLRTRINPVNLVKIVQGTLRGNYIGKIPIYFSFGGREPPPLDRSRWNLARRSGPTVRSSVPIFTLIGAKNPKIGPWVKTIPAELPFWGRAYIL